jgi:tetratricopeptide (TPR) repeat protein
MKVFLSHSSLDKGFVERVSQILRPGTFELDSQTFDAGLINADAIIKALQRSDLFCLFLSEASANSAYVNFEVLLATDFLARGLISKFLIICLDDVCFARASENVKLFNIVRKTLEVESAARLIQGSLIAASHSENRDFHPFLGREAELIELERQMTDHSSPPVKALFISGNFGSGRRTIAQKFFEAQFPRVNRVFPRIEIDNFTGIEEVYRSVIIALRPAITATELKTRVTAFAIASANEKRRLIAQMLNSLLPAQEAAIIFDKGGVLDDAGKLDQEINSIIGKLEDKPHPPVIFITSRMIPRRQRREEGDLAYLAVKSLERKSAERLVQKLLKDKSIDVNSAQLNELVTISDGHPYNIYRMVEEVSDIGVDGFLADPGAFLDWKHRHSSEYIAKIDLSNEDRRILAILKLVPELDFASMVSSLGDDPQSLSQSLSKLTHLHVLEAVSDRFIVSPAVRIAVERDQRIRLPSGEQAKAIRSLAKSLTVRLEEGTAPIALVNAAVLTSLDSGDPISEFTSAFLLPSHYVWLAKRHYDQKNWEESIRLSQEALKGGSRLSTSGFVAACRYLCLSGSRLNQHEVFEAGIRRLEAAAKDDWAKSNVAFLKGFNLRLKGNLPAAEAEFRRAYDLSPGNISAAREIASICLIRGNLDEAESFAREAYGHAQSNAYLVDMLISVLIRKHGRDATQMSEVRDMFDILERVGEEGGRSFYTTRRAEYEHLWGNNKEALKLIEKAIAKTPKIFEPRRLYAEILLKDGNRVKAHEAVSHLKVMVESRDPDERRSYYRSYLETYAHYLVEVGRHLDAKKIYNDTSVFTEEEKKDAIRGIEIIQGYKSR